MTIYDMASEDEQTNLYNALLNPSEEEGRVSFSCHLRRGDIIDSKQPPCYELVHFVGYFRKYVLIFYFLFCCIITFRTTLLTYILISIYYYVSKLKICL